ncbi:MAG: ATP-binding cassette domain-containing protein, partial [Bacteroidetes bacterium]
GLAIEGKVLFDNLSVEVPAGGRLLIKGPSGTGKTTLLRMLLGFVLPDKGDVLIDGEKLTVHNVWQLRQKMAYVSQDIQLGMGTAEGFAKEILGFRNNRFLSYDRGKVKTLLDDFQLDKETLDKKLEDLSGGELQRFTIIVTLLLDRKIFLLDEVTSALDQPLKELIADYFSNLKDKTLIISSHDAVWHEMNFTTLNLSSNGSSS